MGTKPLGYAFKPATTSL